MASRQRAGTNAIAHNNVDNCWRNTIAQSSMVNYGEDFSRFVAKTMDN